MSATVERTGLHASPRGRAGAPRVGLWLGATLAAILLAAGALGMVWAPYDPLRVDILNRFGAPSAAHPLGTDEFGRDVLSRMLSGAATTVRVAALTTLAALGAGTALGVLAGWPRGWVDRVLMALADVLLAFPGILLALGLIAVVGANEHGIILALAVAYSPSVARVVRSAVLSLREREFVEASRVIGNGAWTTVSRHVLPHLVAPVVVLGTSLFGWVVLAESALSFLGLGVPPPAPTWGNMLAAGRPYLGLAPWLGIFPGVAIAMALLGTNLLGDALRDWLDPRLRSRPAAGGA